MTNDTPNPDLAKILVVDDERTTRMAICEALGLVGYTATPVSTGEEALRYLAGPLRPRAFGGAGAGSGSNIGFGSKCPANGVSSR